MEALENNWPPLVNLRRLGESTKANCQAARFRGRPCRCRSRAPGPQTLESRLWIPSSEEEERIEVRRDGRASRVWPVTTAISLTGEGMWLCRPAGAMRIPQARLSRIGLGQGARHRKRFAPVLPIAIYAFGTKPVRGDGQALPALSARRHIAVRCPSTGSDSIPSSLTSPSMSLDRYCRRPRGKLGRRSHLACPRAAPSSSD